MRFRIVSTAWYNCDISQYYPVLEDFGFEFMESKSGVSCYITVDSLEKLTELEKAVRDPLIIFITHSVYEEPTIEIYDDYRE